MATNSAAAVSQICKAKGCGYLAVRGSSFCTEEHFNELQAERKAKSGYRTSSPAPIDYTATLPPANNPAGRRPRGRPASKGKTNPAVTAIAEFESEIVRLEIKITLLRKAIDAIREVQP